MNRYRRRGAFLTEILTMLPLIVATSVVAVGLTARMMRFEGMVHRQATDDSRMADLARRIQLDAVLSESARAESDETGSILQLASVTYRASKGKVVRTQEVAGETPLSYEWPLTHADVRFSVEPVGDGPGVAWAAFTLSVPAEKGPPVERRWSVAARVGGGGGS